MSEVVEVRLLGFPVALHQRTRQHSDELTREFSLISMGDREGVPARLLSLIEDMLARFGRESSEMHAQVDEARARGDETFDLVLQIPASVGTAVLSLDALLDQADEFCREGGALLTLATPPDVLAFRRWYLRSIVDQLSGRLPVRWVGAATPVRRAGSIGGMELTAEVELPAESPSASAARRFARETLAAWGLGELEEAAILLTSELVTNALLHARTTMRLRLRRSDGLLRVEVADDNSTPPVRRHYGADASTGRGLALLEALSEDWGVETGVGAGGVGGGKAVWFTLSVSGA